MKNKFIIPIVVVCFLVASVVAQEQKIDLDALTDEMQKTSKANDDAITLIQWIPTEFWLGVLQNDNTISKAQKDEIMGFIRPYTLILVVDGKIGDMGKAVYRSEPSIRQTIKLIDGQGRA